MLAGPSSHIGIGLSPKVDSADRARVAPPHRVESLTGMRAVAALMVVGTHAAYGTGQVTHPYVGLLYSRLEIGVPIFFVLSGFLLFGPWMKAAATGSTPPALRRYAWRRVRRIMPAYVVTVLLVFLVYQFPHGRAESRSHVGGAASPPLADPDLHRQLHPHVLASRPDADVEPRGRGSLLRDAAAAGLSAADAGVPSPLATRAAARQPGLVGGAEPGLADRAAHHRLAARVGWDVATCPLACFVGSMALAVLQAISARCYAFLVIPVALLGYLIVATPIAGDATMAPLKLWEPLTKTLLHAIIATLVVAPLALGDRGWYARLLDSRPYVLSAGCQRR